MKKLFIILCIFALAGCAALDIADALFTAPKPVPLDCSEKTVGASDGHGRTCQLYTDGQYRWTK